MIRLLRRIADEQLGKDNERLRSALRTAIRLARMQLNQRNAYRADAEKWRSIAESRAVRIDELNHALADAIERLDEMKEQNQ